MSKSQLCWVTSKLQQMKDKDSSALLTKFLAELENADSDPGEIHVCPICSGKLHVSIRIHENAYWGRYLAVGALCDNCKIQTISQGKHIPPWAKESEYINLSEEELWKLLRKEIKGKSLPDSNSG